MKMNYTKTKTLTNREKEVLNYLVQGLTNLEIAKILNISLNTVKAHISAIFEKLSTKNRIETAVYAIKNNLVD